MTPKKVLLYVVPTVFVVIVTAALTLYINNSKYEKQITLLRNELAQRDATIEIKEGLYRKLSEQSKDILSDLKAKDSQLALLSDELKKEKVKVLSVSTTAVILKRAVSSVDNATQVVVTENTSVKRIRVDFNHALGMFRVSGYSLTDPPYSSVVLTQVRPLKLTTAVTQDKSGVWKTFVKVNEEDFAVNVDYSTVNPTLLDRKWYENISLDFTLGKGPSLTSAIGASYDFGRFSLGAMVGVDVSGFESGSVSRTYYSTFSWRPFSK
jgi:hypothetical protein